MKWRNHKLTTFAIVFMATSDPLVSILSAVASVIPDAVEGPGIRIATVHRRLSHWMFGYSVLAGLCAWLFYYDTSIFPWELSMARLFEIFAKANVLPFTNMASFFFFYLFVGCILHVLEDALSGPVPFLHPTKRVFSLKIMRTGSIAEYVISISVFVLSLLVNTSFSF